MASVVLLPGMDGSGLLFDSIIAALNPSIEPQIISYPPDRSLDYESLEALVRSVIPADNSYILVAESFSGPIAIAIAAGRPTGLAGMVLVSTFVRCPAPIPRCLRGLTSRLPASLIRSSVLLRYVLGPHASPALVSQFERSLTLVTPAVLRSRIQSVLAVNVADALARVQIPVLCLSALRDRVIGRSAIESLAQCLPGLHRVEIDGPHFLLQTRALECARAIRSWARAHGIAI